VSRARNIKPGFFRNEQLVDLPFSTRLLFIGLWMLADREGRLEDRPKRIKMEVFPADGVDVGKGLAELELSGFILRYEAEGRRLIQVQSFCKHQNPHVREPASVLPAPDKHSASTRPAPGGNGTGHADSLIPDSLIPESPLLTPESGKEKSGSDKPSPDLSPIVESLPLRDGRPYPIRAATVAEFEIAYPRVDVPATLKEMRVWLIANPDRRKTHRGCLRFVNSWLATAEREYEERANG
jgi:hypothetical protein